MSFDGAAGGFADAGGVGTGFRFLETPSNGQGYRPELLRVDPAAGVLRIGTTPGIAYRDADSLDNALGVAFDARSAPYAVTTTLVEIPPLHGGYAQAGLWVGSSEDEYVKFVVIAARGGTRVQVLRESAGTIEGYYDSRKFTPKDAAVELGLRIDPAASTVTAAYTVNGGPVRHFEPLAVTPALLYRALDGRTLSTAGVFTTQRRHEAQLTYGFDDFAVRCVAPCAPGPPKPDPDFGDGDPPIGRPSDGEGPSRGGKPRAGEPPASSETATLRVRKRISVDRLLRRGLRGRLTCSAMCSAKLAVRLRPGEKRRLPRPTGGRKLGTFGFAAPSQVATQFRVRMPARRLRGLRTPVRAMVRVRVAFADGQVVVRRPVKIRPSR